MKSDTANRAAELAKAHPFGEVVENTFLGFFHVIGRLFGYLALTLSWIAFHAWTLVFVVWLAFSDGFKHAAKVQPKQPAPAPVAPVQPGATHLMDDPRYADHNTPFGVPYGPNVHASHD